MASVVSGVLAAPLLGGIPAAHAVSGPLGRPDLPKQRSVKVHDQPLGAAKARQKVAAERAVNDAAAKRAMSEQHAVWPAGGTVRVPVTSKAKPVVVGGVPVTVAGAAKAATTATSADVTVLDQKATSAAGVKGLLLAVRPQTAGSAKLSVNYSTFASAYGGDWSGRLRLMRMPACAVTTPGLVKCRTQTPVASTNNVRAQSVSAVVALRAASTTAAPNVFALQADGGESPKGSGNYSASKLSASATWSAGVSSGSFTWSYPMDVPPVTAGPEPSVALSYDSGSVDGLNAATNNQGSQAGVGFDLSADSYVERQYASCDDDGVTDDYDECWKYDNASLVLNGKSTELVKDDDTSGTWRLKDDDASTVTHSTGADNGDEGDSGTGLDGSGEYWTVVTGDGTTYVFGLNTLDGAGTQRTNSVWTVPVFGNNSGEPGYSDGSGFAGRSLNQAWRWNLDYVEDTHGNAMSYWYTPETNYYKKAGATTANAKYTRGGYLNEIRYGQRKDTLFTADASAKVTFGYDERCVAADCSSLTKSTADNWPDVPFDQICASGASDTDCTAEGPAFFTRKRLTSVETSVLSGTAYTPVDKWNLKQQFDDGDDLADTSDQELDLTSVQHTAEAGTAITLDPVTFTYRKLANRVDSGSDNILPMHRWRIASVTSETGAITTVTYSPETDCVSGSKMPVAEDNDTMACYPVYWHINGAKTAGLDWFHKYRVIDVTTSDPAGDNEALEQTYDYADPAWHYDDSPFTPENERTWSVWRGYGTVTSWSGTSDHLRSKTVTTFMQGMNGDKQKNGTSRSVSVAGQSVSGLSVASITDSDQYAGFTRETVTYDGATAISATVEDPWSQKTASQQKSYANVAAYFVRTGKTQTSTYLTASKIWRTHSVNTTYDGFGMATLVNDSGQLGLNGDETCTRTWYARNADLGISSLVSRTRVTGRVCSTSETSLTLPVTSATRGDVLSDTATVYDNPSATAWTAAQSPSKGEATWTGRASAYPSAADSSGERNPKSWQTTGTTVFDSLGRPLTVKDAAGNPTSTAYTPTGAGALTRTIVTNPAGQKVITFYDGVRALPTMVFDVNKEKTELTYDALGRLTGVWLPNRYKSAGQSASTTYTYHLGRSGQPYVATSQLGGNDQTRNTSYQIYDALLRPIQTQSPTPDGGRLLTDTRYDSRGLAYETYAGISDSTHTPNGTYARSLYGSAPTQHEIAFDGAGRPTTDVLLVYGVQKGATVTTSYTGDSTASSALTGGSASRVITDVFGRTVERRDYAGTAATDADYGGTGPLPGHTTTSYSYTRDGQQASVTGPDGAQWTYGYDLFGRKVTATDPDLGTTATTYTALDQIDTTHASTGSTLLFGYDSLGRKTGEWQTSRTDANKLAAWAYDSVALGQMDSSTRYDGGVGGKAYTQKVTAYDTFYNATQSELDLDPTDPLVTSGAAQQSYDFASAYGIDGTLTQTQSPAVAGLPQEWVTYNYLPTRQIDSVQGASGYLQHVSYSALSEPEQLTLATSASADVKKAYITNTYEEGTGRLTRSNVTDQTHPYMPQDLNYSYDDAGNVTKIDDPTTQGGTAQADTQCFTYDGYRRLTSAWTPADASCTTTATGGAAPYSTSYTYNPAGLRLSETQHAPTADSTTNYCYADSAQPHTLTATTASSCTGATATYGYDSAGETTKRPGATGSQTLSWSSEGDLSKLTEGSKSTGYLYDADGNLLIRRASAGGESVLYLGSTELHTKTVGGKTTTWAARTYTAGPAGPAIAVRTNETGTTRLSWLAGDQHGTSSLAMDATTQAVTKRYTTPFGAPRGTAPTTWPDDKAFLGKPADADTGLTHIGAREYDPTIGRFLSVDPLLQTDQPQTLNGYIYGADSPTTQSDPTGTMLKCGGDDAACPTHPPATNTGSGGGGTGGNDGGSGTVGGCDANCRKALTALQQADWKDDKNEKNLHAVLAKQLQDYVLALAGDTHPCENGAMVASGTMAACQQLGGLSPQLSWVDLLKLWALGKGSNVVFDAGSPITRQLADDKHNVDIVKNLMREFNASGFADDISKLGGQDDYVDGKNLGSKLLNFPKDLTGMTTSGKMGTGIPDAFTGGYDEIYQVINKSPSTRSFTVAFAAFNDTGTASLFHFGAPDIKRGFGGGSVYQTYYWTMEVSE